MPTLYTIKGTSLPALPKQAAIQCYQDYLLSGRTLQAIRTTGPKVEPWTATGQCKPCFRHLHGACERNECQCNCRMFQS